ncbi:MAG TPA: HAD-IIIC family phosphatase [Ktedonobacteraceae bacterium]|jgi:FkbH-like protein|nr:HAD-IIIC family phosphatase [Ktedonobacteraceae bacterium]
MVGSAVQNLAAASSNDSSEPLPGKASAQSKKQSMKCVVWDLDNTLWNGTLLEDEQVSLRDEVIHVIKTLDERGILNSIASKNEYDIAMHKLEELGIREYFLYPQIHWNSKADSLKSIAQSINIGIDTLAFVDDSDVELAEIAFTLPQVLCINARDIGMILAMPEMNPRFITEDSSKRRLMYLSDIERDRAEKAFNGPNEAFLATLEMVFTLARAREEDLRRAEELTVRTHQLNTTGYTYSYDELNAFRQSDTHKLFIAGLDDRFGTYGKIGLVLVECRPEVWTIKLLLMSCRVMSRGVGTILINYLLQQAKDAGVRLRAEFVPTDRNRMMYVTYKFGGFKEVEQNGNLVILENDLSHIQPFPPYVRVIVE